MKNLILSIILYFVVSSNGFAEDWNLIYTDKDDNYLFIDGIDSLNYVVGGYYSNNDPNDLKQFTFIKRTPTEVSIGNIYWKAHRFIPEEFDLKSVSKIKNALQRYNNCRSRKWHHIKDYRRRGYMGFNAC